MYKDLPQRIKRLRAEKGMTLEQVANVVGVGKSTVRKWETGTIENMGVDKIEKLAKAFRVSPGHLMGWDGEEQGSEPMDEQKNRAIMAKNIKKYMNRKGVSNQMVCEDLGIKYTTFIDWTKGNTYPRIGKIEMMANYFGCEISDLIEDKEKATVETSTLSEKQQKVVQMIMQIPEDRLDWVFRVLQTILANDE